METIITVVVIAIVIIAILNRRALMRIFKAGSAVAGEAGRWAQQKTAFASYQEEVDDACDKLRGVGEGLAQANGLVNSITRQVEFGKQEVTRLEARIKNALAENNEISAATYATQMARVEKDLETNSQQLVQAKQAAEAANTQFQMWQRKITDIKANARRDGQQLQASKNEAALADLFNRLSQSQIGGGISEAQEAVHAEIDMNRGKLQAAMQINEAAVQEMKDDMSAEHAEAQSILNRYRKTAAA